MATIMKLQFWKKRSIKLEAQEKGPPWCYPFEDRVREKSIGFSSDKNHELCLKIRLSIIVEW